MAAPADELGQEKDRENSWRTKTVARNDDFFDASVRQSLHDASQQAIGGALEGLLEPAVNLDPLWRRGSAEGGGSGKPTHGPPFQGNG